MLGSGSVQCSQSQQPKLGAGELRRPRQASSQVCVSLCRYALFHSALLWHPCCCMLFASGLFLGRGCYLYGFFFWSSRSLHRSAGQQVLVNTQDASAKPPRSPRVNLRSTEERRVARAAAGEAGTCARRLRCVHFSGHICSGVMIWTVVLSSKA